MLYIQRYRSPLGEILMAADDAGLVGLWLSLIHISEPTRH